MSNIIKPNSASRRWRATRKPPAPKTFNNVKEPFVPVDNTGKAVRPKPAYKPAPFNVFNHAKAATAQNEQDPADSPGRLGLGGKIPGIPFANRKFPNGKPATP